MQRSSSSHNDTARFFRGFREATRRAEEAGAVIVLFAIALVTSFLIVALAIDGGHLFQQSLLLQKATDAAALVAAKSMALRPKNEQIALGIGFVNEVEQRAQRIGEENVRRKGRYAANPIFEVKGLSNLPNDLYRDRVTVVGRMDTKLFLMDKLLNYAPGFRSALEATATAEVQRSLVSIIVDTSASMICKPDTADCSCAPYCNPKRFSQLRQAIFSFVSQFNDERDKFFINRFSAAAFPIYPPPPPAGVSAAYLGMDGNPSVGFDASQIEQQLNSQFMLGDTNPCDGLYQAWGYTQTAATAFGRNNWGRDYMAYVLFSDGAPTAARFFFDNSVNLALPPTPSGFTDYYSWITLFSPEGVSNAGRLAPYPIPWNWPLGAPPEPPTFATQAPPACSIRSPGSAAGAFAGCVTNFTTRTPDGQVWPSVNPPGFPPGLPPWPFYRQQYYHCAISMADMLRKQGAVVYTIGIGPTATASTVDPYENIDENEERKNNLLLRLANDPRAYPEAFPPGAYPHALFPGLFARYQAPASIPSWYSEGTYFPSDSTLPLNVVFDRLRDRIVRRIKSVQLVPTRPDDLL